MRYALSARSRAELTQFAASKTVLAFDFDGTLAPIVTDPERARMRRTTRRLLTRLAGVATCLALSGRSLPDLKKKLAGTGIDHLVGNHGAEPWDGAERVGREVHQWESTLAGALSGIPGLWIENKRLSLTVHYRLCRRKAEVRAAIARAAQPLSGVRLVDGKESVGFVSPNAPHKGGALQSELARLHCGRALYVGDDVTDEDVFDLKDESLSLFTIRVGRKKNSSAGYFLHGQQEMDELLRLLLQLFGA